MHSQPCPHCGQRHPVRSGYRFYHPYDAARHDNGVPFYYRYVPLQDYGPNPLVIDIEEAAEQNPNYRTTLWTGEHLQVTLMRIPVGGDIGLEVHPTTDQFIRIEEGQGLVQMGDRKDHLYMQEMAYDGYAVMIPAGTWHNVVNTGHTPLHVYVIYAPPAHPHGTVHATKAIAMAEGT